MKHDSKQKPIHPEKILILRGVKDLKFYKRKRIVRFFYQQGLLFKFFSTSFQLQNPMRIQRIIYKLRSYTLCAMQCKEISRFSKLTQKFSTFGKREIFRTHFACKNWWFHSSYFLLNSSKVNVSQRFLKRILVWKIGVE